jgi:hypothetical protein
MLGNLYDRALDGERCCIRHDDGRVTQLAGDVGLAVTGIHPIGARVVASLAAT